jgi:hypothetical protein
LAAFIGASSGFIRFLVAFKGIIEEHQPFCPSRTRSSYNQGLMKAFLTGAMDEAGGEFGLY